MNTYFTTGNGSDLARRRVASISPANTATAVPLNAQVIVQFSAPIDPDAVSNIITVTPSGGSAISRHGIAGQRSGDAVLCADERACACHGVHGCRSSGYQDVVGNVGAAFSSTFTTATSIAPINVSTGFNASGQLITTNNTTDANWSYVPRYQPALPRQSYLQHPAGASAGRTAAADCGAGRCRLVWRMGGQRSEFGLDRDQSEQRHGQHAMASTPRPSTSPAAVPSQSLPGGPMGVDDNGLLAINGTAIMGNINAIHQLHVRSTFRYSS